MRIIKSTIFDVKRIDFCCADMAKDVLLRKIKTGPWTDHKLVFMLGDHCLNYCPNCGAKIETIYE